MTLQDGEDGQSPTADRTAASGAARLDAVRFGAVGRVPWTPRQALRGTAVTLVPLILLIVVSQLSTPRAARPLSRPQDIANAILTFFLGAALEAVFLLAPGYYAITHRAPGATPPEGLRALGLRRAPLASSLAVVAAGLVAILAGSAVYSALIQALRLPLRTNADALLQQARHAPATTISVLAVSVLVAPVCEEIFFRGFLFGGLLKGMGLWPAALLSALLFAVAHGEVGSFVVLFGIGVVLALARWRVGSLWPSVAIHTGNNALAALVILTTLARAH